MKITDNMIKDTLYTIKIEGLTDTLNMSMDSLMVLKDVVDKANEMGQRNSRHYDAVLVTLVVYGGYPVDHLMGEAVIKALATGMFVCYNGVIYSKDVWE